MKRFLMLLSVGVIATIALLLGSCAPIITGPSYQPIYPQKSQDVWSDRDGAGNAVLKMRWSDQCTMDLQAYEDGGSFTLLWSQKEFTFHGKRLCQIHVHDGPVVIEDLDAGKRLDISIFQRQILLGLVLDIKQAVDLVAMLPDFAAVPVSERQYTLSLDLKRKFNGFLPDEVQIQVPDIQLGDRHIQLPPLRLKRYERSGEGWWYAPATTKNVQDTKPAGKAFGSPFQTLVYKPADIWYEEKSVVRIRVVFRGRPFTWNGSERNDDESQIFGEIFIEVFGDEPVRLINDQVAWHVSGDKSDKLVVVDKYDWRLRRYTTTSLSERLDHLIPDYTNTIGPFTDYWREFLVVIPGFHPNRFRVTLPRVDVNGHEWPIQPIEFKYKSGAVGLVPLL